MLTKEKAQSLKLTASLPNDETLLLIENALEWIGANTTVKVDITSHSVPSNVRLFVSKYLEVMNLPIGITSESAGGLSQSFDTTDRNDLLISVANSIFGEENVTAGKVTFVSAKSRWR